MNLSAATKRFFTEVSAASPDGKRLVSICVFSIQGDYWHRVKMVAICTVVLARALNPFSAGAYGLSTAFASVEATLEG